MRLAVVVVVASALLADAPVWRVADGFCDKYRAWVDIRNARAYRDTLSAREVIEWQRVKSEWRKLEKRVDAEYRDGK